jgi:uncharacterized protein (DUF1501 family)
MLTRRSFLKSSALVALAPTVPLFVSNGARAAGVDKDSRVLVVLQLDGGNDALNTLVPLKSSEYKKLRPTLSIAPDDTLKLTDEFGLHSAMRPAQKLIRDGELLAVQGVGYPNPSRSHFESMAVWQSARCGSEGRPTSGWLGRTTDELKGDCYYIGTEVPLALRGRRSSAVALTSTDDLVLADPATVRVGTPALQEDLLSFVSRHSVAASAAAERVAALARTNAGANYPGTELAGRMQLIARLLKADLGARVFYTVQAGYDTHSAQRASHYNLLNELAGAVAAFFADLKAAKLADRVVLLAFSEFGRTIKENGSGGTDHGTAGASFLFGPKVKGGVTGTFPSLSDLHEGEPVATTDFRGIYATLLTDWLGADAGLLQGTHKPVPILH